jgi:hypothetical protein
MVEDTLLASMPCCRHDPGKSHGFYTAEELDVKLTHLEPVGFRYHSAYNIVKAVRFVFDSATGWRNDNITAHNILHRVIYLETVAAVPGMVAAIVATLGFWTMERDGGCRDVLEGS